MRERVAVYGFVAVAGAGLRVKSGGGRKEGRVCEILVGKGVEARCLRRDVVGGGSIRVFGECPGKRVDCVVAIVADAEKAYVRQAWQIAHIHTPHERRHQH